MTRTLILTTAAAALTASLALAASHQPFGAHFIEQWDLDSDGQVTLAEATEKRAEIFTMFDLNEDDTLNDAEYTDFDTHRLEDAQRVQGENGQGMGYGQGMGHGQGLGMGQGAQPGFMRVHAAMERGFNDTDGDGIVSRAEFTGKTADWFDAMDRNDDDLLTPDDFGPDQG